MAQKAVRHYCNWQTGRPRPAMQVLHTTARIGTHPRPFGSIPSRRATPTLPLWYVHPLHPFSIHNLIKASIATFPRITLLPSDQGYAKSYMCMLQMVKCPDRKGVIAALAQLLYGLGCNILASEQFTAAEGVYFQRIRFDLSDIVVGTANVSVLERAVSEVCYLFRCMTSSLSTPKPQS